MNWLNLSVEKLLLSADILVLTRLCYLSFFVFTVCTVFIQSGESHDLEKTLMSDHS